MAAALFAVDPAGIGGVALRAAAGPVRDRWVALLRQMLPENQPWRRVPLHVADGRLLGGLDLAATLQAGRPVAERGLLAEAHGGVIVLAMAERLSAATAARLVAVLDAGEVRVERDGVALQNPAQVGVIAFDEGANAEEKLPGALLDRLAFHVDLSSLGIFDVKGDPVSADFILKARTRLSRIGGGASIVEALCSTAMVLGIDSIRAPMLALRVARAAAALAGRDEVTDADAALAARLVLAPRATRLPQPPAQNEEPPSPEEAKSEEEHKDENRPTPEDGELEDVVLEAAKAAIPAGLLAQLALAGGARRRAPSAGRAGLLQRSNKRGRPIGAMRGELKAGARLNVLETLRAAAPWQRLRRSAGHDGGKNSGAKIAVRREDFRITRFKQRSESTTIFVVDASGSSALHRLAEAKGAVELLLADCYVRRDRVALIAFRGRTAEMLLPPTRSLARAKRGLAGLPGGGGTPLASGIDAAAALAEAVRRRGETPTIVMLTDGRANVARDGAPGRSRAEVEALAAARTLAGGQFAVLFVDTSPRAQPQAQKLAVEMRARYLALPHAGAVAISQAVRASAEDSNGAGRA
jgi:magnesium chelatase subunit D